MPYETLKHPNLSKKLANNKLNLNLHTKPLKNFSVDFGSNIAIFPKGRTHSFQLHSFAFFLFFSNLILVFCLFIYAADCCT